MMRPHSRHAPQRRVDRFDVRGGEGQRPGQGAGLGRGLQVSGGAPKLTGQLIQGGRRSVRGAPDDRDDAAHKNLKAYRSGLPVEAGVDRLRAPVEDAELLGERRVRGGGRGIGPVDLPDRHAGREIGERRSAQTDQAEERGAPHVGRLRVHDLLDLAAEHVRMDLAPQLGPGTAADHPQRIELAVDELLDRGEEPLRVVRDAFEHGSHLVAPASSRATG